jgi:hypothetical protein
MSNTNQGWLKINQAVRCQYIRSALEDGLPDRGLMPVSGGSGKNDKSRCHIQEHI